MMLGDSHSHPPLIPHPHPHFVDEEAEAQSSDTEAGTRYKLGSE